MLLFTVASPTKEAAGNAAIVAETPWAAPVEKDAASKIVEAPQIVGAAEVAETPGDYNESIFWTRAAEQDIWGWGSCSDRSWTGAAEPRFSRIPWRDN